MATYGGAVTQILSELTRADTSITSFVETELLQAIEHYETHRFWFNEGSATFTTSSSLASYAWPTDMLEIDSMMLTYAGVKYEVEPENYAKLNAQDPGTVFSMPVQYAMWNSNFRLYPVPERTYTIIVDYQKRLATLSASTESNAWTTVALDLIKARVEKQIYARRYKDFESARVMGLLEEDALQRLRAQTDKLLGTGRIEPGW